MNNIDLSLIVTYKNKIINGAIILIAVIIGYNLYSSQVKGVEQLKVNIDTEHKKNEVLGNLNVLETKTDSYKKLVNKKDINSIMNSVGGLAREANIKVDVFKPADEKSFPLYTKYIYSLKISCPDYITLGKFISFLENSPEIFAIESLNIGPELDSESKDASAEIVSIVADMEISTILFK